MTRACRPDLEDSPASEPPALGGRYVLGAEVGHGGMATVYQAQDTVLDRTVAVKVFGPHAALPDGEARRAAEVRLLAGLNHPGLVMVYDAGSGASDADGRFDYLVMEFVAGTTLARAIADGPLPAAEVAAIGAQLAAGLGYVHDRGIVHRDVKPPNVLLAEGAEGAAGPVAKLADFGVARLVDSTRLTVHGTTLGTPNYLSPEQATGAAVTPASDIYSLGLVLLEALTGERAFPGLGVEAVVQRMHRQPHIPSHLGPGWQGLLTAMTAAAPEERPSAHTVQMYLQSLADPTSTAVADAPRSATASRHRRPSRRGHWLWPAGGAALAAVGAAVLWSVLLGGGTAPAATFDKVPGPLGADLALLEAVAPPQLHDDLVALTHAAASGQRSAARHELSVLATDLRGLVRSGTVGGQAYWEMRTGIAAVSADLRPATPAEHPPTGSLSATPPSSAPPARPVPQPAGHGDHRNGHGAGHAMSHRHAVGHGRGDDANNSNNGNHGHNGHNGHGGHDEG